MNDRQKDASFDPEAPFHDESGYRYKNLAAYICDEREVCALNYLLDRCDAHGYSKNGLAWISHHYNLAESGCLPYKLAPSEFEAYALSSAHRDLALTSYGHPKDPRPTGGDGRSRAVAAALAALHPAHEPEIPGWMGPRGHLPASGAL